MIKQNYKLNYSCSHFIKKISVLEHDKLRKSEKLFISDEMNWF